MANRTVGYAADGTSKTYTTVAAAVAASSVMDNLQIYYSDASKKRTWNEAPLSIAGTKVLGMQGMLANRQVVFGYSGHWYQASGDLSGVTSQVTIQNIQLVFHATSSNRVCIYWNDTTGGGKGIRVTNCTFVGWRDGGVLTGAGDANVVQMDNCLAAYCYYGFRTATTAALIYFCTAIGCIYGFLANNQATTLTNCAALWNTVDFATIGSATVTYCHSSDDTADDAGGAGNVINSGDPDDLDFWCDNNNSHYGMNDFRILTSSDLYAAGVAVAGITTDCDGNTRADPPSIGWHEGTATAYPGTAPTFAGAASITDNADLTLQLAWAAATGATPDRYEVHLHTASMNAAALAARTYLVGSVENGILTFRAAVLADGVTRLTAGTTYYMAVRACVLGDCDANAVNVNATVTDPRAENGPLLTEIHGDPVFAMIAGADAYTCPASKRATVIVRAYNTDSSGRTVTPHVIPSGDSVADLNALDKGFALGAVGATDAKEKWGPLTLWPGDKVHGIASVDSKVSLRVDGVEQTLQ